MNHRLELLISKRFLFVLLYNLLSLLNENMQYSLNAFPVANAVFYRSYSRKDSGNYETWNETISRASRGIFELGNHSKKDQELITKYMLECKALPSGRWLWCGGTPWIEKPKNYYGAYNCTSNQLNTPEVFGWLMDLSMQGCGTGAVLEEKEIKNLPDVSMQIDIRVIGDFSDVPGEEHTIFGRGVETNTLEIIVGDSRKGWVSAYQALINTAFSVDETVKKVSIVVDVSNVRCANQPLKGFGGTSNPNKLKELFPKIASVLNGAYGRQLTAEECCLICDEAALVVVAGNIRRSAAIKQFDSKASLLKTDLWQQDSEGNWKIDPKRDALRMSNHTRVFHKKPSKSEVIDAVRSQYYSGEGAIQYANEAIARANCDLFETLDEKLEFIRVLDAGKGEEFLRDKFNFVDLEIDHRLNRYGLNPCGEIIGTNYFCNLSEVHLSVIDPFNLQEQIEAFKVAALNAVTLLRHEFENERWQYSRSIDPIIGVSFTGLFDFFVNLFGRDWLVWWENSRTHNYLQKPLTLRDKQLIKVLNLTATDYQNKYDFYRLVEQYFLEVWKEVVEITVRNYCEDNYIKIPNRCTTVQPAGSKSLLTNASPGWHPPKATRYIRRVTFRKNDPVALALKDFGYSVVPSQSDKDELGNLLSDPEDSRCTEWLVEIPVKTDWADEAEGIEVGKFSARAQFDFYMQVQQHYTTHNTSATIEFTEEEIAPLAENIYEAIYYDQGYISAALLARFESLETYPRLPFEPISEEVFRKLSIEVMERRKSDDFDALLAKYSSKFLGDVSPMGCDSDKCLRSQ